MPIELGEKLSMSEILPYPDDQDPEEEDQNTAGAGSDPPAEPPGTHGRKAIDPYEDTEATDDPGASLTDEIEDNTPATDEQLHSSEEDHL